MKKVLVIVGPTSVGKTAFGIGCAQFFDGEIISGDSVQIYRGLDIGSAKATKQEREAAVHHLIDIKDPDDTYSVKEFQEKARVLIDEISAQGKLPIIVGGTGLYIKSCLYDYEFMDEEEEDNQYEDLSNEELYEMLRKYDEAALEKIHINNRKRIVRAINIFEKHKKGISSIKSMQEHKMIYDAKLIGLTCERQELYRRIDIRVDRMISEGLIEEVQSLLNRGVSFSDQSMSAIGYKELKGYFENGESLDECAALIKRNTRHFAKRQYTWFNNQMPVEWFEDRDAALCSVKDWLNK